MVSLVIAISFAQDHDVNILAGVERITDKGDSFEAYRRYFLSAVLKIFLSLLFFSFAAFYFLSG